MSNYPFTDLRLRTRLSSEERAEGNEIVLTCKGFITMSDNNTRMTSQFDAIKLKRVHFPVSAKGESAEYLVTLMYCGNELADVHKFLLTGGGSLMIEFCQKPPIAGSLWVRYREACGIILIRDIWMGVKNFVLCPPLGNARVNP